MLFTRLRRMCDIKSACLLALSWYRQNTEQYSDTRHYIPRPLIWLLRSAINRTYPVRVKTRYAKSKDAAESIWWKRHPSTAKCVMQTSVSGYDYTKRGRSSSYVQIAQDSGSLSSQKWYRKPLNQNLVIKTNLSRTHTILIRNSSRSKILERPGTMSHHPRN